MLPHLPIFTLFPYTTLFRSVDAPREASRGVHRRQHIRQPHPVRAEGGFRALPAHPACRCGNDERDRKSTRLNSSHITISYAVFCLKKKSSISTTMAIATHLT